MIRGGWSFAEILEMDCDQVELFAKDTYRADGERQARLITAINLGNHGKPEAIKRAIRELTEPAKNKPLTVDEALKVASAKK